jgi:hypothetical protein
MAGKVLKLYRGLSSDEFNLATDEVFRQNRDTWASILAQRVKGNLNYPPQLDRSISALHKNLRLEYQYFTDSKVIAEGYARKVGGLLVELSVPLRDVLKHFDIEFQNFGRRKKQFEIVYCVKGSTLAKYGKRWRLKVQRKK